MKLVLVTSGNEGCGSEFPGVTTPVGKNRTATRIKTYMKKRILIPWWTAESFDLGHCSVSQYFQLQWYRCIENYSKDKETRLLRTQTFRWRCVHSKVENADLLWFWEKWEDTELEVEDGSHRYQFLHVTNNDKRAVEALHIFSFLSCRCVICLYFLFSLCLFLLGMWFYSGCCWWYLKYFLYITE